MRSVRLRILLRQPGGDRVHFRPRLLQGDAGFHPRDDLEVMAAARLRFLARECNRHPELVLPVVGRMAAAMPRGITPTTE